MLLDPGGHVPFVLAEAPPNQSPRLRSRSLPADGFGGFPRGSFTRGSLFGWGRGSVRGCILGSMPRGSERGRARGSARGWPGSKRGSLLGIGCGTVWGAAAAPTLDVTVQAVALLWAAKARAAALPSGEKVQAWVPPSVSAPTLISAPARSSAPRPWAAAHSWAAVVAHCLCAFPVWARACADHRYADHPCADHQCADHTGTDCGVFGAGGVSARRGEDFVSASLGLRRTVRG